MRTAATKPSGWLPRLVRESYTAAHAVDGSDMEGRSWAMVWRGYQVEIGLTRRQ